MEGQADLLGWIFSLILYQIANLLYSILEDPCLNTFQFYCSTQA